MSSEKKDDPKQRAISIMKDQKQRLDNLREILNKDNVSDEDKAFAIYRSICNKKACFKDKVVAIQSGYSYLIPYSSDIKRMINKGIDWDEIKKIPMIKWKYIRNKDDYLNIRLRIVRKGVNARRKQKKSNKRKGNSKSSSV